MAPSRSMQRVRPKVESARGGQGRREAWEVIVSSM